MWRFEKVLLLITFVVLGIFGKAALAADPIERAIVACEYELTHFCSTVTPGEGKPDFNILKLIYIRYDDLLP